VAENAQVKPAAGGEQADAKKSALKDKLEVRSSAAELQSHNVIKSATVSDTLQGTATELEKKMTTDRVGQLLESRPEPEKVLKNQPPVAPALQGSAHALERAIASDAVGHLLESRPDPKILENTGVLSFGSAAGIQVPFLYPHIYKPPGLKN